MVSTAIMRDELSANIKPSGTFRSYIDYGVLAKPPLNQYRKTRIGKMILKNNIAAFLVHRSKKSEGYLRDLFPNFIRAMITQLSQIGQGYIHMTEDKVRIVLCELIVKCYRWTYFALTELPTTALGAMRTDEINAGDIITRIAAAAATGSLPAVMHFANGNRDQLWQFSAALGYPIAAAAFGGHVHVVKALIEQTVSDARLGKPPNKSFGSHSVKTAVTTAIERAGYDVLKYLLGEFCQLFGAACEGHFQEWLQAAVKTQNSACIKSVLQVQHQASTLTIYESFETCCNSNKTRCVRAFFETGSLLINDAVNKKFHLFTAVVCKKVAVVRELLDLGASPAGPWYLSSSSRPLESALQKKHTQICCLLLAAGANPRLVRDILWDYRQDVMKGCEKLHTLVHEALVKYKPTTDST